MNIDFLNRFEFFTGVPDSLLAPIGNYLISKYGISKQHIIAANEGNCTALAAGYHLATGKIPVVYLQNSGIGNIINPVASLMHEKVYGIPCVFIVGWRGEPGVHDEPQHIFQGEITVKLLEDMGIKTFIIRKGTTENEIENQLAQWNAWLAAGKQVAFVVCKDALQFSEKIKYGNKNQISREAAIRRIVDFAENDPVISTTGKASRELFEIRENYQQGHERDFLTVGSMGHSTSIALAIALQKPDKKIWCIDGDGAMLMHMGAMALLGASKPENLVHIIINNSAHDSVGGLPTVASEIDIPAIAKACGYPRSISIDSPDTLDYALQTAKDNNKLTCIEIKCAVGARHDLGRPTTTAKENKQAFMQFLSCE